MTFTSTLAFELPPMQGADEGAHYVRADQISLGQPVAYRIAADAAGGLIDLGIIEAVDRFYPVRIDPSARVTPALARPVAWGGQGLWSFPNTAVYPPFFYLPAAAAIVLGKALGLDVVATERLARMSLAVVSVALATAAIRLAGPAAIWLFTLLLLPSSVALMAVITQDGPLLASSALAGGLTLRLQRPSKVWGRELAVLGLLLALIGMSRPPYAPLAFLPLVTRAPPLASRLLATASVLAAVCLWSWLSAVHTYVSVDPTHQANASAQLGFLLGHPGHVLRVAAATLRAHFMIEYAGFFVTTLQPLGPYSAVAWCALALALAASCAGGFAGTRRVGFVALLVMCSSAAIFAIQYLTWTPVGADVVNGVLGRYFLPLAAIAIAGLFTVDTERLALSKWFAVPLAAFPVLSMWVTLGHVAWRSYGASP